MTAEHYKCPECGKDFPSYQMTATNIGNLCKRCAQEKTTYTISHD